MKLALPHALALLPLAVAVFWAFRYRHPVRLAFPSVAGLDGLPRTGAESVARALPWVRAAAVTLCVIALARPQWGVEATRTYSPGIAIAMVVDISSSMAALDFEIDGEPVDRLEIVKETFRGFIEGDAAEGDGRSGDAIGLIAFARYADALTPLTRDHDALLTLLDRVEIVPHAEEDGTAIGDAVALGLDLLRASGHAGKAMIILTDGSNNAGDIEPLEAARAAEALGVRIYAIGAGRPGMARKRLRNPDGTVTFGQTRSHVDEGTLGALAERTGGAYFAAGDTDSLRRVYERIDQLETAPTVAENYQRYREVFPPFLLFAFALLAFDAVFRATRMRALL